MFYKKIEETWSAGPFRLIPVDISEEAKSPYYANPENDANMKASHPFFDAQVGENYKENPNML